jgi:tungstate transport system ATP-binding protein
MNVHAPVADLPIIFDEVSIATKTVTILDRVSLIFAPGTPTVLIGPNGAGKTTLLHAAMGLTTPSRGRITWGAFENPPPPRRAIVFHRPAMLRRSAGGNIRFALRAAGVSRRERTKAADDLLAMVGLDYLADRPARRLSAGEQKRLALARALACDPTVLFLDEPTANLDPAAAKAIEDIIHAVSRRGIKVVLSTHDLGEARRLAGEVILLHRGRVIESGAAAIFFNAPQSAEGRKFIAGELLV